MRQLEEFSKRVETQLSVKSITKEIECIDLETREASTTKETIERKGHLWENISTMVAIAVEIAAKNLRVANNALKIASQMLADMREEDACKKKEIIDLGYDVSQVEDGRVTFLGDEEAVCRANIELRTAERILIKVGSFHAETFDELFENTKALPWEEYIPADAAFELDGAAAPGQDGGIHHKPAGIDTAGIQSIL